MIGYDYVKCWYPFYSSKSENEMNQELAAFGIDNPYDSYSDDLEYFSEFVSGGHERDSSGDHIVLWKRKSGPIRDVIDLRVKYL